MDFIRNQIANFNRNDHDEDDNSNQDQTDRPTSDISPGQVEEAVHYMSQNGYIDISFLRFASSLSKYHKEVQIQDGVESFLDVAVFEVPEHCTSRNCDLSKVNYVVLPLSLALPYSYAVVYYFSFHFQFILKFTLPTSLFFLSP
jgi:hypothetical protein